MKRSARQEVNARNNRLRGVFNLATHPNFSREYGEWEPDGSPTGYFVYFHLGYEMRLRFSQVTCEWLAFCPHFNFKINFPDQAIDQIQQILNFWVTAHIERPQAPAARLRAGRPAVSDLAHRHKINRPLALEFYQERGR
jgi:hypothetical protein